MTQRIHIADGVDAELAAPEPGGGAVPGVIVCHEWYGVTDHVRSLCERFAGEGFVAIAPDLYHGEVAHDDESAGKLMEALSTRVAMNDIHAAAQALRRSPQVGDRKIGVVGFCMGGAMAFSAAVAVDGIACAVPFYGIPIDAYWDPTKVRVPVQAHFAKEDRWAKADKAAAFRDAVIEHGGSMELHVYDAGHAFMRAGDPKTYDAASAGVAWARMLEFLRAHLD